MHQRQAAKVIAPLNAALDRNLSKKTAQSEYFGLNLIVNVMTRWFEGSLN
jgi:hypothetical protein